MANTESGLTPEQEREELQMDLVERLYSLNEGIQPSHGTPQELELAERDAMTIVRILRKLNGGK
jgi:hypothetical protein